MTRDFTALYTSLGVHPDCDVDTLKRLFRRRIAELHPDRGAALSEEQLMQIYLEALRFHRRHGRFPGARVRAATVRHATAGNRASWRERSPTHDAGRDGASRQRAMAVTLLTLLGLALLGLGIWAFDGDDAATAGAGPPHRATTG